MLRKYVEQQFRALRGNAGQKKKTIPKKRDATHYAKTKPEIQQKKQYLEGCATQAQP